MTRAPSGRARPTRRLPPRPAARLTQCLTQCLTTCAAAAAVATRAAGAQDTVAAAGCYAPVARALEALVGHERAQKGIPAISVALVDGRRVVWARGFGWADSAAGRPATAETVYRVGAVYGLPTGAVLDSLGIARSALEPAARARLARGTLWTLDGRRFDAPASPPGAGSQGGMSNGKYRGMYGTVLGLGRFVGLLLGGGVTPEGRRVLARATLDSLWAPPSAAPGTADGGFTREQLNGRRIVGGSGTGSGFAHSLVAMPDDSLGVVVAASLDAATGVTDHLARAALRLMRDARAGRPPAPDAVAAETTAALPPGRALALMGRYTNARTAVDLDEYEGRLYLTPVRGGSRAELRAPAATLGASREDAPNALVVDDPLAYGARVAVLGGGRIALGADTLRREPTPGAEAVAMAAPKPAPARAEYASLIGEYGRDDNTLYVREQDGQLGAVVDWFFAYPLTRVSPDVYRFPATGRYAGQTIAFQRGADGRAAVAVAGTVAFPRRALPGDDDRINARTPPVRPPAELRREALAATPPVETGEFLRTDLVELRSLDPTIRYDIRYATSNNFLGTPFYSSAHAFMQRPAAEAVARASAALRPLGYGLLVHDSYRPWYVTKMFWDGTPPDKHVFVADPAQGSRHNRGAAVDLTLCDLRTGAPIRMTGGYDETTTRSYPLYPGGTSLQRWHRDLLRHAMEVQGFTVYEAEWWHFDYKDWRRYRIGTETFEQLATRGAGHGR